MYTAALDTSSSIAALAVAAGGVVRLRASLPATAGRSAALAAQIGAALDGAGVAVGEIRSWTVGMGPGSFTGIRGGAAWVRGVGDATGAAVRGLPSSLALARQVMDGRDGGVAVLHDGRRGEVIVSTYACDGGVCCAREAPYPVAAAAVEELDVAYIGMLAGDRSLALLSHAVRRRLVVVPGIDAARLIDPPGWDWPPADDASGLELEPVYVRPAVFVAPRRPARAAAGNGAGESTVGATIGRGS